MRRRIWLTLSALLVAAGCAPAGPTVEPRASLTMTTMESGVTAEATVATVTSLPPPPPTTAPPTTAPPTTAPPTTAPPTTAPPTTAPPTTAPPTAVPAMTGSALCASTRPIYAAADPQRPRYNVTADINPDTGFASGRLSARFMPDRAVDHLVLRLWPNSPRQARLGANLVVTLISSEPPVVAIESPDPTIMVLRLARPLAPAAVATLELDWNLQLANQVPERVAFGPGWARLGSFLPLLAWEPGVGWAMDPPTEGNAEASTFPAAEVDLTVNVPEGYHVYATGNLVGNNRFVGVAVRDVAISVGRFRRIELVANAPGPVAVQVGVEVGLPDDPADYGSAVVEALESFAKRFGPYLFGTYQLAITPNLRGGIEYPGLVMQGPGSGGRTTPHEVAHQWFYGLVGNNQGRDPMLDEGLATFAEISQIGTADALASLDLAADERGDVGQPMHFWDDYLDSYYEGVYLRGAFAVARLGPQELVDCALARFVARHAYDIATQRDLVSAMVEVFPDATATLARYGLRP